MVQCRIALLQFLQYSRKRALLAEICVVVVPRTFAPQTGAEIAPVQENGLGALSTQL